MPNDSGKVSDPAPNRGASGTQEFARQVLIGLGAPPSPENIAFLVAWFKREGVNPSYNNPLATTQPAPGATNINSVGVKHYTDQASGVAATVKTLNNGRYKGIVTDLRAGNAQGAANNHPDEFKTWSGGGYDRNIIGNAGDTIGGPTVAGGATAQSTTGRGLPPGASDAQVEEYIREEYGSMAAYLDVPEVRDVLVAAARAESTGDPWSDTKIQHKIEETNWWRTNSDSARQALYIKTTDPASYQKLLDQKRAELEPTVKSIGYQGDYSPFVEEALTFGYTPEQVTQKLSAGLSNQSKFFGLTQGSSVDTTADQLATMARSEYLLPLNRQDLERWAIGIFDGSMTEDMFREYMTRMTAARFPGLSEQGITPGEYFAPIKNVVADLLELQPGDVDLLNNKFSAILESPDGKGGYRPMSISEAQRWARALPEYRTTKGANDSASELVETLTKTFGAV